MPSARNELLLGIICKTRETYTPSSALKVVTQVKISLSSLTRWEWRRFGA